MCVNTEWQVIGRWICVFELLQKDWSVKTLLKMCTQRLLSGVTDSLCMELKWGCFCLFISAGARWQHKREQGMWWVVMRLADCQVLLPVRIFLYLKKHHSSFNTLLYVPALLSLSVSRYLSNLSSTEMQALHNIYEAGKYLSLFFRGGTETKIDSVTCPRIHRKSMGLNPDRLSLSPMLSPHNHISSPPHTVTQMHPLKQWHSTRG